VDKGNLVWLKENNEEWLDWKKRTVQAQMFHQIFERT